MCPAEHSGTSALYKHERVRSAHDGGDDHTDKFASNYAAEDHVTLLDANENAFGPCIDQNIAAPSTGHGVTIQSALDPKTLRLNRYPDA